MWRNVGIERNGATLGDVAEMCEFWGRYTLDKVFDDPFGWETQNMLQVASVIVASALDREESRGCHRRRDFPEPNAAGPLHDLRNRRSDHAEWVTSIQNVANTEDASRVLPT